MKNSILYYYKKSWSRSWSSQRNLWRDKSGSGKGSESAYFINLIKKEGDKHTKVKGKIKIKEQKEMKDNNKNKKGEIEILTPIYGGYKKSILINANRKAFINIMNERKIKREPRIKRKQNIGVQKVSSNLFEIKQGISKVKKMEYKNIIEEKYKNIELRKVENKLKSINYYFTPRYVARSMTTQLRSWPNTIYSYIKGTIRDIKYKDIMASKVINIFMNPIYLKRKIVQEGEGINSEKRAQVQRILRRNVEGILREKRGIWGISIKGIKIISKYINEVIKFTSIRSRQETKDIENYNNIILTLPWIKKEINLARSIRKYLKERRSGLISGYMPKRRVIFNKERKMYISKPLFKHTAWNVIIDLYIYNNKSYKLGKYHNMLKLRALYKYMYSMYINYKEMIQNIMSRPRIFYINIIEPKTINYYSNIIESYEKIMIHMSKKEYIYKILNILTWNNKNEISSSSCWGGGATAPNIKKYMINLPWNYDKMKETNYELKIPQGYHQFTENIITKKTKIENENLDKIKPEKKSKIKEVNEREISQKNNLLEVIERAQVPVESIEKKKNKNCDSFAKLIYKKSHIGRYENKNKIKWLRIKNNINKYRSIYNNKKKNIFINNLIYLINKRVIKTGEIKNDLVSSEYNKDKGFLVGFRKLSRWNEKYFLLKEQEVKINKVSREQGKQKGSRFLEDLDKKNKTMFIMLPWSSLNNYTKKIKHNTKAKIKENLTWSWSSSEKNNKNKKKEFFKKEGVVEDFNKVNSKKKEERRVKIFGKDKLTLKNFKRKISKGYGKKYSKIDPKFLKEQTMKYNLYGISQKADNNPNQKWVYDTKTKIKVHISKYLEDKLIFNKIKERKERKQKVKQESAKMLKSVTNNKKVGYGSDSLHLRPKNNITKDQNQIIIKKNKNKINSYTNNHLHKNNKYNHEYNNNKTRKVHTLTLIKLLEKKDIYKNIIKNRYSNKKVDLHLIGSKNSNKEINPLTKIKNLDRNKILIKKRISKKIGKIASWYNIQKGIVPGSALRLALPSKRGSWSSGCRRQKINYIRYVKDMYFEKNQDTKKRSWDLLDNTIMKRLIKLITKTENENKNKKDADIIYKEGFSSENKINYILKKYTIYSYEKIINKIKNNLENISDSDKLYIDIIKQDFYNVNRDVLVSKSLDIFEDEYDTINKSYNYGYKNKNLYNNIKINFKGKGYYWTRIWQTLNFNNREENIINNLRFSDKVFKPYYRYTIRLFILNEYKNFIKKLGYKNIILHYYIPMLYEKFNWIRENNLKILNFIGVKTLFNLFIYNYRSLFILKPKYYYINKYRYYKRKGTRLKYNTWLRSIKYLKALRKAPKSYWLRYHKLINYYYIRIVNYAKWDTERKVIMPYVLYFEDILFNIYGKLAIIRIWPLKRYFLSSYILSERLMLLLDKKANWSKRRKSITGLFTRFVFKFINMLKVSKIDKIYEFNLENNSKWPKELINIINKNIPKQGNYNKLEYNSKKLEMSNILSTYLIRNGELENYIPLIKFYYYNLAKNTYLKIKKWKKNKYKLWTGMKKGLIRYWTRPIKNYVHDIISNQDISGVELRLTGRAKSKARAFSLIYQYGTFLGAKHFNKVTHKYLTISSYYLRNSLKSTMDYTQRAGNYQAGTTNLKLWYSSLLSSDIMELLSYLIKMKEIYNALINRNFIVHSNIKYYTNYYKWNRNNTRKVLNYFRNNRYKLEKGLKIRIPKYTKNRIKTKNMVLNQNLITNKKRLIIRKPIISNLVINQIKNKKKI